MNGEEASAAAGRRIGAKQGSTAAEVGSHVFEEHLPEHILEFNPDAVVGVGSDGRIVLLNRRAEEIFGYSRGELIGEQVEVLIPERFRTDHVTKRRDYFADPATRPMGTGLEFYGLRRDGSEFPADISASALETGAGRIAIAVVRDLSESVEAERELLAKVTRAERAARSAQASRLESLGQLAGGVAHDFNNLLAVILGYTELIAGKLEDGTSAHRDALEIRRAAEMATQLTRQLLIFSRRDVIKPVPIDLSEIAQRTENLLRRTLGEHVELAVDLAPDLPPVLADPGQVEQVLVNLAINARDAMPEGGRLSIETAEVELDEEFLRDHPDSKPGRYVRLTVADTGCGMEPEVAARAFEPFFSTKRHGEGTGLGLATVYGIVRGSGGQISIYSEPGIGTTIKVHLPATESKAATPMGTEPEEPPRGHGERILIVEDDAPVRELARRVLGEAGYSVIAVESGADAVSQLSDPDRNFDLLLTDVVMPQMLGSELARRARELNPDLPVVMMSGYADPVIREGEPDEVERLVEKPFSAVTLLSEVHAALQG